MVLVRFNSSEIEELVGMSLDEFMEVPWKLGGESRREGNEFVVEFNPDRPDLYSVWGLARAIRLFMNLESYKPIQIKEDGYSLQNDGPYYRPIIVSAVVKGSEAAKFLSRLLDYQEKLHGTLGRNRKLAAIGIHDLDKIKFPLKYTSVERDYDFYPLGGKEKIKLGEFMNTHEKAKEFGNLVEDRLPAIIDKNGDIISLPPILNSELTSLSNSTKNFFIDVTGIDGSTVVKVLNLMVSALVYPNGEVYKVNVSGTDYPVFQRMTWNLQPKRVKEVSGVSLGLRSIKRALSRMGYEISEGKAISPEYRIDIFQDVDFIEDILKGYGYENIPDSMEDFVAIGMPHELRSIENIVRHLMVGYGFTETVNFSLINGSYNRIFGFSDEYLSIINPVTLEQNVIRPRISLSLIQSLLNNHRNPYPQKIFEIGTVIRKGKQLSSLGIAICHREASFSEIKGVFLGLMEDLEIEYGWEKFSHKFFVEGRAASIITKGKQVGFLGEVDPSILKQIGLKMPLALGEIDITGAIL